MVEGRRQGQHRPDDDLAGDRDRSLGDRPDQHEHGHPVVAGKGRVRPRDPPHPHRGDHRAAERLPAHAEGRQVQVEVGGEPGAEVHRRTQQPRRQQVQDLLRLAEGLVESARDRLSRGPELLGDLHEGLLVRPVHLAPGELAALGSDDEEDVRALAWVLPSAGKPDPEIRHAVEPVGHGAADGVRHGDVCAGPLTHLVEVLQQVAGVELEVAVELRVVGWPPERPGELAPPVQLAAATLRRRGKPACSMGTTSRAPASGSRTGTSSSSLARRGSAPEGPKVTDAQAVRGRPSSVQHCGTTQPGAQARDFLHPRLRSSDPARRACASF